MRIRKPSTRRSPSAAQANGQFEFTGKAALSFAGHTLVDVEIVFNNSGIRLSTFVSVLGITVSITGALYSDGSFELTAVNSKLPSE